MKRTMGLVIMLLVVSALSFGQFTMSINASNTFGIPSKWTQVAFGADGILHLVWAELKTSLENDIMYATWDGTTLSTPKVISGTGVHQLYYPYIAVNNKGMIAVIYTHYNEFWLAVYDPETKEWAEPAMIAGEYYGAGLLSKPKVTLDEQGNIYAFFWGANFETYSRSKINGDWEDIITLSNPGEASKEGGICAAPDGKIWVVYGIKGGGGEYLIAYRSRTADTDWTQGELVADINDSHEQPFIGVGHNPEKAEFPYIAEITNWGTEGDNYINLSQLDLVTNPRIRVAESNAYHFPRVAVDNEGFLWVASQFGQGDEGLGIKWFENTTGVWINHGFLPNSQGWPKLPGIASDAYGNVAISWDSWDNNNPSDGTKEAFFSTRYPVEPKRFYPPSNTKASVSVTGMMSTNPQITFKLSWEANPDNNDSYIRGYKIYKRLGSGEWEELVEVAKDTLSYEFILDTALTQKIQFAIATVSVASFEGEKKIFGAL